jgi:hypothetical protein
MPGKSGTVPKDKLLMDGFNQTKIGPRASQEAIRKAQRESRLAKERLEVEKRRQATELLNMEKKIASTARVVERAQKDLGLRKPDKPDVQEPEDEVAKEPDVASDPEPTSKEDEKSAHQMLQDLRYAYRNAVGVDGKRGKQRLKQLMENDADFKFAVKELLKIEASLLAAKIRKDGGNGESGGIRQQNFFVVLKGLEDGPKIIEAAQGASVDMKQVQRAINPEQGEVYEAEEAKSMRDVPVQLQKQCGSV